MENQEEQTEDSFLSPKLDEQPAQEEIEEEV